jgi:GABA(A) receptor-associated protein
MIMNRTFEFQKTHSFEKRETEARRIRDKYPGRVPIIVEKDSKGAVPNIDKNKYLVPGELTVGQFLHIIRTRIKLSPEQAIFIFVNNTIPPSSRLISEVYEQYRDDDGFLYFLYSGENCFGQD